MKTKQEILDKLASHLVDDIYKEGAIEQAKEQAEKFWEEIEEVVEVRMLQKLYITLAEENSKNITRLRNN